jgi:beta-lactam-binding protein with PASTA domain
VGHFTPLNHHFTNKKSLKMAAKENKKNFNVKNLLINPYTISLVALIIIFVALFFGTSAWLKSYTQHGVELIVPDVTDLSIGEAEEIFKDKKMKCEIIDSVFMSGKRLGGIVEQIPPAGSKVKEGRTIYLITNSNSIRKIALPDVREISLRQAEAMINSVGLKVDSIEYVPSEYKDLVKDAKHNGKILSPGSRIPEGSLIVLMVGKGNAEEQIEVPSFRALNASQSLNKAHAAYVNIGEIIYDVKPKDEKGADSYFVYKQTPITGTVVKFGESIDIYLTKDPTALEVPEEIFTPAPTEEESETEHQEAETDYE